MFTLRSLCAFSAAIALGITLSSCGTNDQPTARSVQDQLPIPASTETVTIPASAAGMGAAAYGVNPLSISEGSSVIWTNDDTAPHTATSSTGIWDTGTIAPGASSSPVPFNSPGVFPYYSTIDGEASMNGTIEVVASPSPSASPSVSPTPSPSVTVSPTPSPTPSPTVTTVPTSPKK